MFEEKMADYFAVKAEITRLDKIAAELNADLKEAGSFTGLLYKSTVRDQTRASVDAKALEKEHPAIYQEYLKTTSFQVLTVKKI